MKILFYLPVVTPWWFEAIIVPMLRRLQAERAELHVMIAPLWRSTGIAAHHLGAAADLTAVQWHIVDEGDPADFRRAGAQVPGLLDLVHAIAPDLTLCRSAEQNTPALFPGTVRYIMEGAAAPFETDVRWIVLEEKLFAYGTMPHGGADVGAQVADELAPLFARAGQRLAVEPQPGWRAAWDLPDDRPILCVPLQYEHEEDFFIEHSRFPRGLDLIDHLLRVLDPAAFLAVTDHPLNRQHVDRRAVDALIAANPDRARLCLNQGLVQGLPLGATGLIASRAEAVLADQSKCWTFAAFAGTPLIHIGNTPLAGWLGAGKSTASFPDHLHRPDTNMGRRWFGWHLGTRLLDSQDFTLGDLLTRVAGSWNDRAIAANVARLMAQPLKAAA